MAKKSLLWDQPVIKVTLSTDTAASILAIQSDGTVVKRPAIDTTGFITTSLTSAHLLIGNGSNVATDTAVTGDVTITNGGATSIGSGKIVNAQINASAAIALSKLAALTPSRAAVLDSSGFLAASTVTSTTLAFLDATSSVQTQINGKLSVTITSVAAGDILHYSGTAWVNLAKGSDGQFLKLVTGQPAWATLTPPNIPTGGTAGQYLNKIDGTDYNSQWSTLTASKITDVTASAAELNKLTGATLSTTELNYVTGVTSSIQSQFSGKQATITGGASSIVSSNLTADCVLISDAGGKISQLAASSDGYVLTLSGGLPIWANPSVGGTVTSVDVSGGGTGLTTSGGPVTTNGTITLAGTLNIGHGGTGASLSDPGANALMGWDDTDNSIGFWTLGTGLTYTHATHTLSATGGIGALSSLTAATGTNTIDNVSYTQEWQWNSLAGSTGLKLTSTSTSAASNLQVILQVNTTGSNSNSAQTTYAAVFNNTHSGTSSTNVGIYSSATGGTSANYAIWVNNGDIYLPSTSGSNFILDTNTGTKFGTATSQKLSFWAKTPIVQPTTGIAGATRVGGGGTTVTTTDTFGGYTLAQLAAIIINTGLAA